METVEFLRLIQKTQLEKFDKVALQIQVGSEVVEIEAIFLGLYSTGGFQIFPEQLASATSGIRIVKKHVFLG